jgi:hypothetical protein
MTPDKRKMEAEEQTPRASALEESRPSTAADGRPGRVTQPWSHTAEEGGATGRAEGERRRQQQVGNTQLIAASSGGTADIQLASRGSTGGGDAGSAEGGAVTGERLNEIEAAYRAMIADSRSDGYNVAADNLQRFLDGTGGTKTESVTWLRGFAAITAAERTNQERFEDSLTELAYTVPDGGSRTFNDHWDRMLTASQATELYYASGTSSIKSTGSFTLTRSGNVISITGTVNHHWYDPYDWHGGLGAWVPGHGVISDSDALLMEQHRGARPFDMEADWTQTVSGRVEIVDWWFDDVSYNWTGP